MNKPILWITGILWLCLFTIKVQPLQAIVIVPTTTVAQETQNNTSASNSFSGTASANGNPAPGNVSKVAVASLLYPQAQTQVFVNFLPWFCLPGSPNCTCDLTSQPARCNSHILSGYNSNDAAQVKIQVTDMLSRGIQGAIISWYGPNYPIHNGTSLKLRDEAATRNDQYHFAIMDVNQQNTACEQNPSCDVEAAMISDLIYAATTYLTSPAYLKTNAGVPIVLWFDPDGDIKSVTNGTRTIDWNKVAAGVAAYPMQFIFYNNGGFTHPQTSGSFSWPQPTTDPANPTGFTYLTNFYQTAKAAVQSNPSMITYGSAYKGFNDSLAGWSPAPPNGPRVIGQQCGQTWLKTFSYINSAYAGNGTNPPLSNLQIATWNDYDEGTELETGIDNCLSISDALNTNGSTLTWSVQGDTGTLDHFTVFVSSDDNHLMVLLDNIPVTSRSLDMTSYAIPPASYLRVKAVGKASFFNHLSNSVATPAASSPTITVSPTALTFLGTAGGSNPAAQTLTINDTVSGTTLNWSVVSSAAWLTVTPISGASTGGATGQADTVSVNLSGLVAGNYSGLLTISGTGATNTPQTVAVSLSVSVATASLPTPDLSALNGNTYPLSATLSLTYNTPVTGFVWSLTPVATASGSRPFSQTLAQTTGISAYPTIAPQLSLSSFGFSPGMYVLNVKAVNGSQSSLPGTANIALVYPDLTNVRVYPNPWREDKHAALGITFDQMAAGSTLKIFTVSGHAIKSLPVSNGSAVWDLTNEGGHKVASGLYLYLITDSQGNKKTGTLAIIH